MIADPGCSFCSNKGHTWCVDGNKRICFACLISQRNAARGRVQGLEAMIGRISDDLKRLVAALEEMP